MIISRLYLRNYRVYEDELELELPPGLIGVYGPNGAGKSYLVESIRWIIFGQARTGKEEVRSSGLAADCVTELDFSHEGHLYRVRRVVTGPRSDVKASAEVDGALTAEGVREVARYMHSVLGMDDESFRASVFAEQKQLAAFSSRRPAERRDLVLGLLGVTPLDLARDASRRDARESRARIEQLRTMLPDVDALRAELEALGPQVSGSEAQVAAAAAATELAESRLSAAQELAVAADHRRRAWQALVEEGQRARQEREERANRVQLLEKERAALKEIERTLPSLQSLAAGLAGLDERLAALGRFRAAEAEAKRAGAGLGPRPAEVDPSWVASVEKELTEASTAATEASALLQAAKTAEEAARLASQRAGELSGEASCPLCGQALGAAFEAVKDHRAAELGAAQTHVVELEDRATGAEKALASARRAHQKARSELEQSARSQGEWERREAQFRLASEQLERALAELGGEPPSEKDRSGLAAELDRARAAAAEVERIRGRLERSDAVSEELASARQRLEAVDGHLENLRAKVKEMGYSAQDGERAVIDLQAAKEAVKLAAETRRRSEQVLVELRTSAAALQGRVDQAREQRALLVEAEGQARHLGRVAELLSSFRNNVVASIGPRLAAQAAELFAELTDHDYDRLEVDPESYELHLSDQGISWGMARFSGSETDLANLALRVAISEQAGFQSGGAIGLLVLDEIFGPLDEDRRDRMLAALQQLRSRFEQILVVTHGEDIKQRLPNAIEVTKLPGRRARASLI